MGLCFERFQREYYLEYASWFSDPELNYQLGPMDEDWLSAVLDQEEDEGITWAIFLNLEMVGVVETWFDPQKRLPVGITGIAVKPAADKGLQKRSLKSFYGIITVEVFRVTVPILRKTMKPAGIYLKA